MPEYSYKAKNQTNQIIDGIVSAQSDEAAVEVLHAKNYVILNLEMMKKNVFGDDLMAIFNQPNKKDLVIFTRQLATLISADVPLIEGLRILVRQVEKPSFAKMIVEISAAIEGGAPLSGALATHPKLFTNFYVSLVRSGEASGRLDSTLLYLAEYLERSAAMNSKIRGALAYPVFVLFAMVVVSILMVTLVLPNLLTVLKEAGVQDLPITTKVLIAVTDFVNGNIILLSIVSVGLLAWLVSYARTDNGREYLDTMKVKLPAFGKIVRDLYIARIAETLSTLIRSGVPILQGLEITSEVVGNIIFKRMILAARENVKAGGTISETLSRYEYIPPLVTSMLAVGERTGRTDFMLDNILRFYKAESEDSIQNISQVIEPALILILGVGVALLVSSILLPIYSLVSG